MRQKVLIVMSIYFMLIGVILLLLNALFNRQASTILVGESKSGFVMVTAAHIPSSDFKGYTKIYEDEELDVAVYKDDRYDPSVPKVNTEVKFIDESTGVVVDTDDNGFYVEQEVNTVAHGFSGSEVVSSKGEYLGFVSSMDKTGRIYCLAY